MAWPGSESSGAVKRGKLCYQACCVAVDADGKCKLHIAATAAESLDMSVRVSGSRGSGRCFTVGSLRLDRAVVQSVLPQFDLPGSRLQSN